MKGLEEILKKNFVFESSDGSVCFIRRHQMEAAIKEAYNKGVTDSAENVKMIDGFSDEPKDHWIDKQTILKLLIS